MNLLQPDTCLFACGPGYRLQADVGKMNIVYIIDFSESMSVFGVTSIVLCQQEGGADAL